MLILAGQYLINRAPDEAFIVTNNGGCAQLHGNRPFGILSQRQTGNAQATGLFLNAARVGQNQFGLLLQADGIEVVHRRYQVKIGGGRIAKRFNLFVRAGVNGKNERDLLR